MKTFKYIREQEKLNLIHQKSPFRMIFMPEYIAGGGKGAIFFPVTKRMINKYSDFLYSFHETTKPRSFHNLIKNQNKKNVTISGTSYFSYEIFYDGIYITNKGYSSKYYCIFLVRGQSPVQAFGDMWTIPDNSGQRWINYEKLFAGFPDEYMTDDVIQLHSEVTKTIRKFYSIFMQRVKKEMPNIEDYFASAYDDNMIKNLHPNNRKKIEKFIKMYILGCEKIIDRYIKEFSGLKKMARANKSTTEVFAENLVSNYEIVKAFFYYNEGHIVENRKEVSLALSKLRGIDHKVYTNIDDGSYDMWKDFKNTSYDVRKRNEKL